MPAVLDWCAELFQTFLSEDFDIDTFMSVINLHNVSRLADRLNAAVRTIDAHIHAEVRQRFALDYCFC